MAREALGWPGCYWLRDGLRDGGAEQFEGAALDGGGGGEFLDALSAEDDDLPVEGGEVGEQVAVAVDGQAVVVVLGAVLGLCGTLAGATGSLAWGMCWSVKVREEVRGVAASMADGSSSAGRGRRCSGRRWCSSCWPRTSSPRSAKLQHAEGWRGRVRGRGGTGVGARRPGPSAVAAAGDFNGGHECRRAGAAGGYEFESGGGTAERLYPLIRSQEPRP